MTVDMQVRDRVATIVLNRPASLNAIDTETRASLFAAVRQVQSDDVIAAAVLTGAGERAFSVGVDLKEAPPGDARGFAAETFAAAGPTSLVAGMQTDKPVICAINGLAVGGGLELAMACDIRVAADHAEFGLSEARLGSMPGSGGTQLLPRLVGRSMALQMLLTGDRIDAPTALRCGLVSETHPLEGVRERAAEIAQRIAANAPLSLRAIKRVVAQGADLPVAAALDLERYAFGLLRDTADRAEGRRAFADKRPPAYRGR